MKKNYELVEVKVISLDNEDVITASGETPVEPPLANNATRNNGMLGDGFDLGGLNVQGF